MGSVGKEIGLPEAGCASALIPGTDEALPPWPEEREGLEVLRLDMFIKVDELEPLTAREKKNIKYISM